MVYWIIILTYLLLGRSILSAFLEVEREREQGYLIDGWFDIFTQMYLYLIQLFKYKKNNTKYCIYIVKYLFIVYISLML